MALPLIPIAAAIANGAAHVLTKPWPWAFLGLWLVASKFDLGIFAQEARDTLWSLWWVVALIIIGFIVNSSLKVKITEHGKTQRYKIKEKNRKNE